MAIQKREITFITLAKEAIEAVTPSDLIGHALDLGISVNGVELSNDVFANMAEFDTTVSALISELEGMSGIIDVAYAIGSDNETIDLVIQSDGSTSVNVAPNTDIPGFDISEAMHVASGATEIQVDSRRPVRLDAHANLGLQSVIAALSSSHAAA